jgi:hypothetical protein
MTDSTTNGGASMDGGMQAQYTAGGGTGTTAAAVHPDHYSLKPQAHDVLGAIVAKYPGMWSRNEGVATDGSQTVRFTHEAPNGDRIAGNGASNMEAARNLQARMEAINA